jgi:hypothetical protein
MIPGEGSIHYKPFVQALEGINDSGFVSAELGFQYTLEPDAAVQKTHTVLSEMFRVNEHRKGERVWTG